MNNITERLNLYTKLNEIKTEEELQKFELEIVDRFGELPTQVLDLFDSVRLKWIAIKMGIEKLIMKNGKMVGYFIKDQQSQFYQSESFTKVLTFVQHNSTKCKMKEKFSDIHRKQIFSYAIPLFSTPYSPFIPLHKNLIENLHLPLKYQCLLLPYLDHLKFI